MKHLTKRLLLTAGLLLAAYYSATAQCTRYEGEGPTAEWDSTMAGYNSGWDVTTAQSTTSGRSGTVDEWRIKWRHNNLTGNYTVKFGMTDNYNSTANQGTWWIQIATVSTVAHPPTNLGGKYNYSYTDPGTFQGTFSETSGTLSLSNSDYIYVWVYSAGNRGRTLFDYVELCPVCTNPSLSTTITHVSINGGSDGAVNLSVSNGNTPYTYSWSNSAATEDINGLVAGTYTVTVTETGGCTAVTSVTVTEPDITSGCTRYEAEGSGWTDDGDGEITAISEASNSNAWKAKSSSTWVLRYKQNNLSGNYTVTFGTFDVETNNDDYKAWIQIGPSTYDKGTPATQASAKYEYSYVNNGNYNYGPLSETSGTLSLNTSDYIYIWLKSEGNNHRGALDYVELCPVEGCVTPSISSTVTHVTCASGSNGAINLSITNGTPPYTFSWNDSNTNEDRTGLSAGTYTVTVTESGSCTETASIVISEDYVALDVSLVGQTNVTCGGASTGSVTISAASGLTPYTYAWSNSSTDASISSLSAGTYTVTATDACNETDALEVTITEAAVLGLTTSVTDVACNGTSTGSVTITVTGGTTPYTYAWSNSATTQYLANLAAGTYTVTVTDANACTVTTSKAITQPASALDVNLAGTTNILCNGASTGSVNITASGGTVAYTYLWSDSSTDEDLNNVAAGTYTVTVTDANLCTTTVSETLTEPTAMTLSTVETYVSCYGNSDGEIDLTVYGGVTDYTYIWSNNDTTEDVSGVYAATYTVTVTDGNNCNETISLTITEPTTPVINITLSKTDVSCNGASTGAINITASGGTTPYIYIWSSGHTSNDITGLIAGAYYVTVYDEETCMVNTSTTITEPPALSVSLVGKTDVTCNGGSDGAIEIVTSGGVTSYTYKWNGGLIGSTINNNVPAGIYTVTVTDACSGTASLEVEILQITSLSYSLSVTNVSCIGGNIGAIDLTVSGGTTPYSYDWREGITTEDRSGLSAGEYSVIISDNCYNAISVDATILEPYSLIVTPNIQHVLVNGGSDGSITLNTSGGTTPYSYLWNGGQTNASITGLSAGSYTVTVTDYCSTIVLLDSIAINEPEALDVSLSVINISCNGSDDGSISSIASGGTGPYNYLWSNNSATQDITGLSAGSYTVTVTDYNGSTVLTSATITEPPATTTSLSITSVTTNVQYSGYRDGTIDITVQGGTLPYSYIWSNGTNSEDAINIGAGTYTVTVSDGCALTTQTSATITEPSSTTLATGPGTTYINPLGGFVHVGSSDSTADLTVHGIIRAKELKIGDSTLHMIHKPNGGEIYTNSNSILKIQCGPTPLGSWTNASTWLNLNGGTVAIGSNSKPSYLTLNGKIILNGTTYINGPFKIGDNSISSPSNSILKVDKLFEIGGADLILGTSDGREQGNCKKNRALVHNGWDDQGNTLDELVINFPSQCDGAFNGAYEGDFEGGVVVGGSKGLRAEKIGIGIPHSNNGRSKYSNSDAKLVVNGKILATSFKIKSYNKWPDYVFTKDYNLKSLPELESFIKEHNHLPEMPSARQVSEDGYSLEEINATLLKKVEELTLYVIQQNKEIEKVKTEIKNLTEKK